MSLCFLLQQQGFIIFSKLLFPLPESLLSYPSLIGLKYYVDSRHFRGNRPAHDGQYFLKMASQFIEMITLYPYTHVNPISSENLELGLELGD